MWNRCQIRHQCQNICQVECQKHAYRNQIKLQTMCETQRQKVWHILSDRMPENMQDRMPAYMSEISGKLRMCLNIHISNKTFESMSDIISEYRTDRFR